MAMRLLGAGFLFALVTISSGLPARADARQPQVRDQEIGSPVCEEFHGKWEVPGVSPMMLAMAGLGREIMAANDCLQKNNFPMACKHWGTVLEVSGKLGPPFDQDRAGIEALMSEHKCEADLPTTSTPDAGLNRRSDK